MTIKVITPKNAPPPLAPYSPGILAAGFVFVSGTLPMDTSGKPVGRGDVRAQTSAVLDSIRDVLEAAGASLRDVVFNQIMIKDLADYKAMNEVYGEYFPTNPPARYCIRADLVKPDFLVEIVTTAYIGDARS
jgi:aminoacrylate peracid reductase